MPTETPWNSPRYVRRDLLTGGLCALGAGASAWLGWREPAPHLPRGGLAGLIPTTVGAWRFAGGDGVIVAQDAREDRGQYDDLLARNYGSLTAPPVTLLLAYGSSQMDVWIHRPEACYPAAGFALSDERAVTLRYGQRAITANVIFAQSLLRCEWLLYWTRIGSRFPASAAAQRAAVLQENLAGRVPDGILLRVSTPEVDRQRAMTTLTRFLQALHAELAPVARTILFGA